MTIGYDQAHERVQKARGLAREHLCPCGRPAEEWSFQGASSGKEHVSPEGLRYSLDINDYLALCRKCHHALDRSAWWELAGETGRRRIAEMEASDPGFRNLRVKNALRAAQKAGDRIRRDPELRDRMRQARQEAIAREMSSPGSAYRETRRSAGLKGSSKRRRCKECGMVSVPGPLGRHQKLNGHKGVEDA